MDNQLQLEIERWAAVPDYFGLYTVSTKGRIMGLKSCRWKIGCQSLERGKDKISCGACDCG